MHEITGVPEYDRRREIDADLLTRTDQIGIGIGDVTMLWWLTIVDTHSENQPTSFRRVFDPTDRPRCGALHRREDVAVRNRLCGHVMFEASAEAPQ